MTLLGLQFVWWGPSDWVTWASYGPYPSDGKFVGSVYRWSVQVGPLEIRKWTRRP